MKKIKHWVPYVCIIAFIVASVILAVNDGGATCLDSAGIAFAYSLLRYYCYDKADALADSRWIVVRDTVGIIFHLFKKPESYKKYCRNVSAIVFCLGVILLVIGIIGIL